MKRASIGLTLLTLLSGGCGWYTNLPASVYVAAVKPGKITYEPANAQGVREIKTENPVVTFRGEPGSIGVTIDKCIVRYMLSNDSQAPQDKLPGMTLGLSFRVESSNYPTQPGAGRIDHSQVGQFVEVGKTEVEVPLLTRHVEAFGQDSSVNASLVTAVAEFKGSDDAMLPVSLYAQVPIYFSGQPGGR